MNTRTTTKMRLTTENVEQILTKCLYTPTGIPTEDFSAKEADELLKVEGINKMFTFNPDMLEQEKQHIEDMLDQLPEQFKEGWCFWEMYRTRDGRNWTTKARIMEALMVLGIAVEKITYVLPKNLWWSLPGGVPYIVVNT